MNIGQADKYLKYDESGLKSALYLSRPKINKREGKEFRTIVSGNIVAWNYLDNGNITFRSCRV